MAGPDTKLSQRNITVSLIGSYFHIIIPDGSGGFLSYRMAWETIAEQFMTADVYDPQGIAADVFDSLNSIYDNTVSGLTSTDVQNAIDELSDLISEQINNVNYIDFIPQFNAPAYNEGRVWYDLQKRALAYYTDDPELQLNPGREIAFLVPNTSGADILNGTVVCPDGNDIGLADNRYKLKSRPVAVATTTIENGGTGNITKLGQVTMDTSGWNVNDRLYLGTNGQLTTTLPTDGGYVVLIGIVDVVGDETTGIITVDIQTTNLTVEVTDANGFPPDQRTGTTVSFDEGTRTVTIAPTGSSFHFYELGEKYEKDSAQNVVITDVEGEHFIFFQLGVLTAIANPSIGEIEDIILKYAYVCNIYWNATDSLIVFEPQEERHGMSMSPQTHLYLHRTRGAVLPGSPGFAVGNIISDATGNLDTHAQYSVAAGVFYDEDINHVGLAKNVGDTLPVLYIFGANAYLRDGGVAGFGLITTGTGRLAYNQFTGGAWQLTEVGNNNFVLYHLFAINGFTNKVAVFVGQNEYATVSDARTGANSEIGSIISAYPLPETVPLATIIYQTSDSYTNTVKARIRTTDTGADYVDWRTTDLAQGVNPSSHANLTDLLLAGSGVLYGHVSNLEQTIAGNKLFSNQLIGGHYEQVFDPSLLFDLDNGNTQQVALTANLTDWTVSNLKEGGLYRIYIIQDGIGGWTIPDPTGVDYEIDSGMVFNLDPDAINIIEISVSDDGTSFWEIIKGKENIGNIDITKYIAISGNDSTGDGTSGTPYATLLRAIQDIPPICSNIIITFIFNEAGTYVFGDDEKTALGNISYSACRLFFEGVVTVIESGVSFTEIEANKMLYTATKAGVTVAENDWRGYFLNDSNIRFYPVSYNSAGSDSFQVEYMRGARNGTRDIVDMQVILDMSAPADDQFLEFNFIGLPKITFWKCTISRPGGRFEMTTAKAFYDFTFGLKWNIGDLILGQYSEHSITNFNFTGNFFLATIATDPAIDTRNSTGNYNFTRCVIHNPNNSATRVLYVGKNSITEIKETTLIGGGGNSFAFSLDRFGHAVLAKTVVFREMLSLLGDPITEHEILSNTTNSGYNYVRLFGLSYIVNLNRIGIQVDLWNIDTDGSFVDYLNKTNVPLYIDEKNKIRINILGTHPNIESFEDVVADSAVNQYIEIGAVSENETIDINYTAIRNTLIEKGKIELTNQAGTSVSRTSKFDDVGLVILKNISGDLIRLDITDALTDGNSTRLILDIKRTLTN